MSYHYGDAYEFDGYKWRYACNGELVPDQKTYIDPRSGEPHLDAPEMLVHQMIDLPELAAMMKVKPSSVPSMLYREQIPKPQFRAGKQGALWSRPVIRHFIASRPGQGWAKGISKSTAV